MQVALQPSILHLVLTGLPHLARLSGVARELVPALTAKAITPLGTLWMVAFQLTSCPSSSRSLNISPWKGEAVAASELFEAKSLATLPLATFIILGFSTLTVT